MTWHPDMPEPYKNQIVTGDARELAKAIPDESIDLILCDPAFSRVQDYEWVAKLGARVLRPGGNLIAECGTEQLSRIVPLMNTYLDWCWLLTERFSGGTAQMWNKRIMVFYAPFLWYSKGKRSGGWLIDSQIGKKDKNYHEWGDGSQIMKDIVGRITESGDVILDPFTGGGTVPTVCKLFGRNYIAFEIDPTTAETARQRVAQTQVPWFVALPEQLDLVEAQP